MVTGGTGGHEKADRLCAGRRLFTAVKSVFQSALNLSEPIQANHSIPHLHSLKAAFQARPGSAFVTSFGDKTQTKAMV
jgi:hypothetical protein